MGELPDHVARNRSEWDGLAAEYVADGERRWAAREPSWGIWGVPESELRMLPADCSGIESIELGCGTAYVSAWLARRGAAVTAIDNSEQQLRTARRLQAAHGLEFPLLHGNAEQVPIADASFDLAISEYGASIWCDPYAWIPEAARLLRPGGRLVFLVNARLAMICTPDTDDGAATERLVRPYFGDVRFEWSDTETVEFNLPHGEMITLLRDSAFELEELIEVRPAADATTRYPHVPLEWARRWPCEEVWKARRR